MIEWLTPFKLFAFYVLAVVLLAWKAAKTPVPPPEPDQVDLKTVRATRRRELWDRRHYNMRLSGKWVRDASKPKA